MKILIIRSASLERLDALLGHGHLKQSDTQIDILTHSHAAKSIKANYPSCGIIEYPRESGFTPKGVNPLMARGMIQKHYDEVIVLVSNLSGKGHHAVLKAAFLLSERVRIFNTNGELIDFKRAKIQKEWFLRIILFPAIFFGTLVLAGWGMGRLLMAYYFPGGKNSQETGKIYGQ